MDPSTWLISETELAIKMSSDPITRLGSVEIALDNERGLIWLREQQLADLFRLHHDGRRSFLQLC